MKNNNFPHKPINLASRSQVGESNFDKRIKSLNDVITSKLKTINGLILRNKGRGLVGWMLKFIRGVLPRSSKSVVKQTARFSFRCYRMAKHSGLKGLVLYLKACQVMLQQVVGGYKVVDLTELKIRPARNRVGLPLWIPAGVRVRISRDRDIPLIRLWMSLFGLYRVLDFQGKLNLDTITQPGVNIDQFLPIWEHFLESEFKPNLKTITGSFPSLGTPKMFPISKSGPTTYAICGAASGFVNSSVWALILSARVWLRIGPKSSLLESLKTFISNFPGHKTFISRMETIAMADHRSHDLRPNKLIQDQFLGRLGIKPEPAGKLRVFAMVDAWTQWLMYPLHEWIFSLLRKIPQDGTFDQMSPVELLQKKYSSKPKGLFSSIDLSAATDRLPIALQKSLLKVLLKDIVLDSEAFSESWADLLVKREYEIPKSAELDKISVSYAVGQPMGALSSWAMLALTHHAMMQFCSSHKGWFTDYAVLGDDGVIKGQLPTWRYQQLLKLIGVKAGLAKSILAKNRFVIEFAKKFFVDATTANMLPVKESVATLASTSLAVEFVRKYDLSLNSFLSFIGYGYKVKSKAVHSAYFKLSTRLRVLLVWLSHPSSPLGKKTYIEWIFQKSWYSYHPFDSKVILEILKIMNTFNQEKSRELVKVFTRYYESISNIDKVYDEMYPISLISISTSALDQAYTKGKVPWKAVLSPDLDSSDVDYDFLTGSSGGGMSNHGYRYKSLDQLSLGISYEEFMAPIYSKLYEQKEADLSYLNLSPDVEMVANMLESAIWLQFEMDDLKGSIPEKFWAEERVRDRPFRDFLSIYKFWQDLSKPIWSFSYGKDIPSLRLQESKPKSERGSIEEPVQSLEVQDHQNRPWVDFLIMSILTFVSLGMIYDPPVAIVIDTTSTVEPSPLREEIQLVLDRQSKAGLILIGLGVSLLLSLALVAWVNNEPLSSLNPFLPWMEIRPTSENVGPLSLNQLNVLQVQLENRALLDNLAISPIGDLWIDPW